MQFLVSEKQTIKFSVWGSLRGIQKNKIKLHFFTASGCRFIFKFPSAAKTDAENGRTEISRGTLTHASLAKIQRTIPTKNDKLNAFVGLNVLSHF